MAFTAAITLLIITVATSRMLGQAEYAFQSTDCQAAKSVAIRPGYSGPDPTCDGAGRWAAKQCWASRNQCWCVDTTGREIQPRGTTTHRPWGVVKDCNAYRNGLTGVNLPYSTGQGQQCPPIDNYEVCSDNIDRCSDTSCGLSQRCCQTKCRKECRTVVGVGSIITPAGSRVDGCQTTSCPFGQRCIATTGTCDNGRTCTRYECKTSFNSDCPPAYSLSSGAGVSCTNDVNCRLAANERCCSTNDGRNKICARAQAGGTFGGTQHAGTCPPSTSIAAIGSLCSNDRSCGNKQKCCRSRSNTLVCTPALDATSASLSNFPTRLDVGDFQSKVCSKPNEVWSNTRGHCRVTCAQIVGAGAIIPSCPDTRLAGCVCQAGYFAAENGDCVTKFNCEQQAASGIAQPNVFNESNDLRCENNEVWSVDHGSCHITCAQVVSGADPDCPKVDVPGCVCQPGYARATNGRCIPIEACGLTVGSYFSPPPHLVGQQACFNSEEVWSQKYGNCDIRCDQVTSGTAPPSCFGEKPPRCVCKPGYARKPDGSCIQQHKCAGVAANKVPASLLGNTSAPANRRDDTIPHPSQDKFKSIIQSQPNDLCNDPNETWDVTNGTCHLTCEHVRKTHKLECYDAPKAGCVCRDGFVKNKTGGKCVPVANCAQAKVVVDSCYGNYEERKLGCGLACELTCADRQVGRTQPSCTTQTCAPRCECKQGSIRSVLGGQCVLEYQCTGGNNAGLPGFTNFKCVAPNTVMTTCSAHPDCQATCQRPNPDPTCSASRCLSGCVCRVGYVRRSSNSDQCILQNQCGLPTNGFGTGGNGGLLGKNIRKAVAVFKDAQSRVTGTVFFDQVSPNEIRVSGTIQGISARGQHGFHIHRKGDITGTCSLVGEHYNPKASQIHGGPSNSFRHVGDLGNILADGSGVANINLQDRLLTLNGPESIVGRALVISSNPDDLGRGGTAQSTIDGNSGPPLACAVIGIETDY